MQDHTACVAQVHKLHLLEQGRVLKVSSKSCLLKNCPHYTTAHTLLQNLY